MRKFKKFIKFERSKRKKYCPMNDSQKKDSSNVKASSGLWEMQGKEQKLFLVYVLNHVYSHIILGS